MFGDVERILGADKELRRACNTGMMSSYLLAL